MSTPYFVLHLSHVNRAAEEWLSGEAFSFGALGVSENLSFSQPEGEEDIVLMTPEYRSVDVYFESVPSPVFVETLRSFFPDIEVRVKMEANRDWLAEWKQGFKPFSLVKGHWVVPSWCTSPPQATHQILIDPGMAFGTGTHETTQLVARQLEKMTSQESLLDVGTGTGILAILAWQLGYSQIHATETDEEARRVANENFLRNQVPARLDERQVGDLMSRYDVVVANIIDGVLVRIQDALMARVKPGGWLIVSGIIDERERDFLEGFRLPANKTWVERQQHGDWLLFAAQL